MYDRKNFHAYKNMDFDFSVKVQQIAKHTDMANVARKSLFIQLSTSINAQKQESKVSV